MIPAARDAGPARGGSEARRWWRVAFGAAFLLLTWALYSPRVPAGPETDLPLDKLAHLVLFAITAALGVWAGLPLGWLLGLMLAQAVASELVQGRLVDTRSGDPWDLAADLLGIAVGLAAGRAWTARAARRARPAPR